MKYVKYLANGITAIALAFIAFSSFSSPAESENAPYYEYTQQGMLGEIRINGMPFEPTNWRICDGRSIEIEKNKSLHYIIGDMYGGDDTTFKLPDLRSKRLFTSNKPEWDSDNYVGQYMICTLGHSTSYWDSWNSYYDDGIPTGW